MKVAENFSLSIDKEYFDSGWKIFKEKTQFYVYELAIISSFIVIFYHLTFVMVTNQMFWLILKTQFNYFAKFVISAFMV